MSDYDRTDYPRPARPILRWVIILGGAFVAGLLTMGWVLTRWDTAAPYLAWMRPVPTPVVEVTTPPTRLNLAAPPVPQVMQDRVAELEGRIDRIADRAEAASGNADRAEGLLVAFAARRAIDRGLQLGYIEGLLRHRFGRTQPAAVATILSSARQPLTLDELRADLDVAAPDLVGLGPQASWWDSARRELANMIVIRHTELPSARPDDRVTRARQNLEAGYVDRALAEIARLPARDKATDWMKKASRYIAVHNALDLIETAALLTPEHPTREGNAPSSTQ